VSQENRIVAIGVENPNSISPYRSAEPPSGLRLRRLIDTGTIYVAQNLTPSQFATLQAIASLILHSGGRNVAASLDATLSTSAQARTFARRPPLIFDFQLGLDELDTITRTRTGYAFAELPEELQDAILDLIDSRDLTTRKLDLALWLEHLRTSAAAL
jgi:hypothetical protein